MANTEPTVREQYEAAANDYWDALEAATEAKQRMTRLARQMGAVSLFEAERGLYGRND